jgi:hypothetical protein
VQYATPVDKENLPADVQKNSYIAYSRNGMFPPQNPYGRLYIMTSSGQDYGLIAEENYYIYSAWSSDGKYLAYTTLNKITILDMTDPQFYRVKPFYTAGQVPSYAKQQQNLDMSEVCESINSITWKPGAPIIVFYCFNFLKAGEPTGVHYICEAGMNKDRQMTTIPKNEVKCVPNYQYFKMPSNFYSQVV